MASTNSNRMSVADDEFDCHRALDDALDDASIVVEGTKKRMLERANECRNNAKRMRAEADRLEQEADQMDIEACKFRTDSHAANALGKSLHYETLLIRLKRNDKKTVVVDTRNFPPGHGKALGEALRRNTMVTKLDLQFSTFFSALDSEHRSKQEMKPLLEFLKNNSSLVSFGAIRGKESDNNYVLRKISNMLLESISKLNQIERLEWDLPVAPSAFHRIMTTFESLRELDVAFGDVHGLDTERLILSAFRYNLTLRKLNLAVSDNLDLYTRILSRLSIASLLEELCLSPSEEGDEIFDALSDYLQTTSTLRRLELRRFFMDDSEMTKLLSGLQGPNDNSDVVPDVLVSQLCLSTCCLTHAASSRLSSFLRTKTGNALDSGLRELVVSVEDEDIYDGPERMGSFLSRKLATSLLMAPTEHAQDSDSDVESLVVYSQPLLTPTIGSQITTLSLVWVHSCFFDHLRDNADRVGCLQSLELVGMTEAASKAFSKCMPKLRSLHTLKILPMSEQDPDVLSWIVRGLQRNQSILTVTTSDDDTQSDFSDSQLRLVDAYCQRNRFLVKLLGSELCGPDESSNGTHSMSTNDTAALSIRPELLTVAYHIPDARSAMFMQGLLALGCSVGEDKPSDASPPRSLMVTVGTALWSLPTGAVSVLHSLLFGTPR